MSKILEKVVSVQLCSLLQHNDIYEKVQSGFRNGASSNYKWFTFSFWPRL